MQPVMSKNIGFDAKRAFNNVRGLGNYSRDTIRVLSSQYSDNQYFLFTPKVNPQIPFAVPDNAVLKLPENGWQKCCPSLWRTYSLADEAAKCRLDLFHGLSHELPVGIRRKNIPTVVTIHDLIFLKFPQLYPAFDRMMYRRKYLRSCEDADKIIAVSEQTKRDLVELAGVPEEKVEVVYQGCSPIFRQTISEEQIIQTLSKYRLSKGYVLSVGALEERKNHLLILRALVAHPMDIRLVIIGNETAYASVLRQYVAEHHMDSQVTLLTGVPFADFPALYRAASVFVYPSLFEGFGIPVLEALCSHVPVIAATGSCLEESGGPHSCYIAPDNADELACQLERILSDAVLRQEMVAHGDRYSQQFTDEAIAQRLWSVYAPLLG